MKTFIRKETSILAISCACFIILIAIILYLYLAIFCFHLSFKAITIFLSILLFAVQLPGNIILYLLKLHFKSNITKYPIGFFLGFALLSFIYYIAVWMKCITIIYFYIIGIICMGGTCLIRYLKKPKSLRLNRVWIDSVDFWLIIYFFIVFFGSVTFLQFQQVNIEYSQSIDVFQDLVWHMGIVNSISKDFFPICPWSGAGIELKYHFFCDLLYGIIMRISGVPADVQILQCSPFLTAYLFTTSTYALLKELLNRNKMAVLFAAMIIPASFVQTNLIEHILVNTNNVATALSCLMCILVIINVGIKDNKKIKNSIILAIFVYLLTGLKGPFGAVLFAAMIGTCFFSLAFKTRKKKTIIAYTSIVTISFVSTYLIFLTGSTFDATHGMQITLGETMKYSFLSEFYYAYIASGADHSLKYIILSGYIIIIMGACFLPFLIQLIKEIKNLFIKCKPVNEIIILNYAIVIVGFAAWMLLNFDSNNQIYFGFASIPSLTFIAAWYFSEGEYNTVKKAICYISIICILCGGITGCKEIKSWINKAIIGYHASQDKNYEKEIHRFSYSEYQAMLWLRYNTKADDLIAGDRYSLSDMKLYDTENRFNSRWFYYTAYSQRTFFLEGTGYGGVTDTKQRQELYEINESLYDSKNGNSETLARKLGIDYIVVSERIHPGLHMANSVIKLCYTNRDMRIYKVLYNAPEA